jgi:hypothetical protein
MYRFSIWKDKSFCVNIDALVELGYMMLSMFNV